MSKLKELMQYVLKATWSLQEAAHLVHERDPVNSHVEIDENSTNPVCKTYFWLKKEYEKDRLHLLAGSKSDPRFSPGTLMRHLEQHGHHVSASVRKLYDASHGTPGPKLSSGEAKEIYRAAALYIWQQCPNLPAAQMGDLLVGLPQVWTKGYLPSYGSGTIRKWVMDIGPGKPGRPKKISDDEPIPDLKLVAAQLEKN
jgi:hypothetical protein